jgi:ATP-dependent Clp protease ATP-binding subunit ClpC
MSEYMEKHSVSRLVGSPPGYVGHEEGGQLTEIVRRKPYCVVLLDEIEKAHPDVFNILLQILEDGRLTDSQGRAVDFRNVILIMTSNIGASTISKNAPLGFAQANEIGMSYDDMKGRITSELKRVFRPEFLNRVDEVIVFHKLDRSEIRQIVDLLIARLQKQITSSGIVLQLTEAGRDLLVDKGFDPGLGARPLRRAIQRYIEDKLADAMLDHQFSEGSVVLVDAVDDDSALSVNGVRVGGSVELPLVGMDEPRVSVGGGPEVSVDSFEDQPGDAV